MMTTRIDSGTNGGNHIAYSPPGVRRRQAGVSLIELLVATAVSLVAVSGMVLMMSSSLGATNEIVTSARLANELRAARQIIERDVRRANYSEDFAACIGTGQSVCLDVPNTLTYTETNASCITYRYERGAAIVNGAVRLDANSGALQFRTDDDACGDSANWQNLNDTDVVTVTRFTVSDPDNYTQTLVGGLDQLIRKINIEIEGQACLDAGCNQTVTRVVTHTIRIRNDVLVPTP